MSPAAAGHELAAHQLRRQGARASRTRSRSPPTACCWPRPRDLPADRADQLAAITSGLISLTQGAARLFEAGDVMQTVIEMEQRLPVPDVDQRRLLAWPCSRPAAATSARSATRWRCWSSASGARAHAGACGTSCRPVLRSVTIDDRRRRRCGRVEQPTSREGALVRPYAVTGGRTEPDCDSRSRRLVSTSPARRPRSAEFDRARTVTASATLCDGGRSRSPRSPRTSGMPLGRRPGAGGRHGRTKAWCAVHQAARRRRIDGPWTLLERVLSGLRKL